MGIVIQSDDFTRIATTLEGSVPSWKQYTPGTWAVDGVFAKPTNMTLLAEHRALINSFDPRLVLPTTYAAFPDPWRYSVEAKIKLPSVFPTGVQFSEIGVIALANCSVPFNSVEGWECVLSLQGSGNHFIQVRHRQGVAGTPLLTTLYTFTGISAAVAGAEITLKLRITVIPSVVTPVTFLIYPEGFINDSGGGLSWSFSDPTFFTQQKFCGIWFMANGPTSGGFVNSTPNFHYVRVRDERILALPPFFPEPTLPTVFSPTAAAVVMGKEDEVTAIALPAQPEYALEQAERFETNDFYADGGFLVTHAKSAKSRRVWQLHFAPMIQSERDALWGMVTSVGVNRGVFLWTHPETDEVIRARVLSPQPVEEEIGNRFYIISFDVEEIFAGI